MTSGNDKHYLILDLCNIYIIMIAMPEYFTQDTALTYRVGISDHLATEGSFVCYA